MREPAPPLLAFGERFRVTSRSGKEYVVRFLHRGRGDSGVFVRTDGGHVARFDARRVEWSTYEPASGDSSKKALLSPGDEVLVDCSVGSLRGKLLPDDGESTIRLENGLCVKSSEVYALHLLFRAPALMGGDRFWIRTHEGVAYSGDALSVGPKTVRLRLTDRSLLTVPVGSLDFDTLLVAIPIPREVYT